MKRIVILALVILVIATGCVSAQYDGVVSGGDSSQDYRRDEIASVGQSEAEYVPPQTAPEAKPVVVHNSNTTNNYYPARPSTSNKAHVVYKTRTVAGPTRTKVQYVPVASPAKPVVVNNFITPPPVTPEKEKPMEGINWTPIMIVGMIAAIAIVAIITANQKNMAEQNTKQGQTAQVSVALSNQLAMARTNGRKIKGHANIFPNGGGTVDIVVDDTSTGASDDESNRGGGVTNIINNYSDLRARRAEPKTRPAQPAPPPAQAEPEPEDFDIDAAARTGAEAE